jgi:hypothetical protein
LGGDGEPSGPVASQAHPRRPGHGGSPCLGRSGDPSTHRSAATRRQRRTAVDPMTVTTITSRVFPFIWTPRSYNDYMNVSFIC